MRYEVVILEMLARINQLETEVAELRMRLDECQGHRGSGAAATAQPIPEVELPPVQRGKMTDEMIEACYYFGKRVRDGENPNMLAYEIQEETGMNLNSATMYLYAVSAMLDGVVFKRAISGKAMRRYFDLIWNEYGSRGLKKAIKAARQHADYRRSFGQTVDSVDHICDEYERRL